MDTNRESVSSDEYCYESDKTMSPLLKAGLVTGNTAAGLGVGVVSGIGLVIGAAFAEVAVPAFLVLKALGLTGGAMGFLRGLKKASE